MVRVLLVEVVFGARLKLGWQLVKHTLQDAVDALLLVALTMPDGDKMRVKADAEAYATELVSCCWSAHAAIRIAQIRTLIEHALQLFTYCEQLNPRPNVRANCFGNSECPASSVQISAVLPDGFEALLEEVDTLAHLDLVYRGVVRIAPKILDGLDLAPQLLKVGLVVSSIVLLLVFGLAREKVRTAKRMRRIRLLLPVEPDIPVVLGRKRAHDLEEIALGIISLFCGRRDIGRVWICAFALGETRQASGEE